MLAPIKPLDLDAIPCDFYGGNGHKSLLAPTRTGFLHIGRGNEDRLQPLQVSWGYYPSAKALAASPYRPRA